MARTIVVRLLRPYLRWPKGAVVELASGVAQTLIDRGSAEAEGGAKRIGEPPRNKAFVKREAVKHGAC